MVSSGLATMMFTDLVGSTRQRDELGDDVADQITGVHDQIVSDALASTGGRLVKKMGDGALVVFDSAVDAVAAAQRIQEGVRVSNRTTAEDHQIGVRIGINAGEVAHDNGDPSGLPVVVASRVCDAAESGQILVTSVVRSLIGRRARFPFRSAGSHKLKGVTEQIELWSVEEDLELEEPSGDRTIPFPGFLERGSPITLVGRDEHLAHLDASFKSAGDGVQLVTIIGEPGIGKTALTAAWCRLAADDGATVVAGRSTPEATAPYQPFTEIARSVLGVRPELLTSLGPAAGNLAQLVPGIDTPAGLPPPVQADPDTTRYLMAEAFATLLRSTSNAKPTVVVLDDLHWADEHSIAVLAHLARHPDDLPLLIVGTYRDTDLVRTHPLPALLTDLRRERRLDRLPLPHLTGEEVGEMIKAQFGREAPPNVIASISDETQGNPFFIEEITAHLVDEGAIDGDGRWVSEIPIEDYGIPEGVRDVVGRRLDRIGEDGNAALEVAAVIGLAFSIDLAGTVAGLDEQQIDEVVDTVMNAGLITEGEGPDEFTFAHALVRQTLYEGLPARRRTRLHRVVGEALDQRDSPPATTLHHWLNANETARALPAALAAADSAVENFAISDVFTYLELALDLWEDVDDPEEAAGITHAALVQHLTTAYYDFGDPRGLGIDLIMAELESDELEDELMRGLLLSNLATQLWVAGRQFEAQDADFEALRLVPAEPPSVDRANVQAYFAGRLMLANRHREAIEAGEEALGMARAVGAGRAETRALSALATAHGNLGDVEASDRYFDELRDAATRTGLLSSQLVAYSNQGSIKAVSGQMLEGLRLFDEGAALGAEVGVDRWEAYLQTEAARVLFDLDRWDESAARIAAAPPLEWIDMPELSRIQEALILATERGDDDTVRWALGRIAEVDVEGYDPQSKGPIWAAMVSRLRWSDELEAGYDLASSSLSTLADERHWAHAARLTALAIELVADASEAGVANDGWIEAARGWHERFFRDNVPVEFAEGWKATAAADVARAEGNDDPDLWRAAVTAWGDQAYFGAKARWRLADALMKTDPADEKALGALAEAGAVAEQLGARPLYNAVQGTKRQSS